MNTKSLIIIFALAFFASLVGIITWTNYTRPNLAYVNSGKLVEGYLGMKEAKTIYKDKMSKWKSNMDTLQLDFQRSVNKYNLEATSLSKKDREERENYLKKQEMNIRQYASSLDEKAKEEDDRMTEGVLNQINSYVKEFGEKKGYDLILGVTSDGNILYGKDAIDITNEVLKGINENYKKAPADNK
jgi:outer membrane protein